MLATSRHRATHRVHIHVGADAAPATTADKFTDGVITGAGFAVGTALVLTLFGVVGMRMKS